MANNAFLVFLILGGVILGALGGYFVFLGIYQEQFAQQDRITLENFESASAILYGTLVEVEGSKIIMEREGLLFPIQLTEDTLVLVSDEEAAPGAVANRRIPVREGTLSELSLSQTLEAVLSYNKGVFTALRINASPRLAR